MRDFIRIGGGITSSPLNENFRRLLNEIQISNTNLVFTNKEDAEVNTITEMLNIQDPVNGQVCYVVSSGELYRYFKRDDKWHKIMDIGQTFRQGFLNSGLVVMEGDITLKKDDPFTLIVPSMLVYFKNKPGDDRYLKGMYLVEEKEVDPRLSINGPGSYSIMVDCEGNYTITSGMPKTDDPNHVFIGTFLVGNNKTIYKDFIFTLPDIAYTADRGGFLIKGGDCEGCNLVTAGKRDNKVNRKQGYYYDEGVNYSKGSTLDFPVDTDNGSNFNLKTFGSETLSKLYYMAPYNSLDHGFDIQDGLITDKVWSTADDRTVDLEKDFFTIQYHLVTPNGINIMVHGSEVYNSVEDATSHLNDTAKLNLDFPYVEATRVVVGNKEEFNSGDQDHCRFYTMGRLAQVGTISPKFADDEFMLYSGQADDNTPATFQFDLSELEYENFDDLYKGFILPYNTTREKFGFGAKYNTDNNSTNIQDFQYEDFRNHNEEAGYEIADNKDLDLLRHRVYEIEKEIWNVVNTSAKELYEQSIRYRLFHLEDRVHILEKTAQDHEQRITTLEKTKVSKDTSINGYKLGDDNNNKDEKKVFNIYTGDIDEGKGLKESSNLWYTEARVSANSDVSANTAHRNKKGTGTVSNDNPHGLSTDNINVLSNSNKLFVTKEESARIKTEKLPDDTKSELNKKIENVKIQSTDGTIISDLGNVKTIRFKDKGVNLDVNSTTGVALVECVGQFNYDPVLLKQDYTVLADSYPELYQNYVDNSINSEFARNVMGIESATANQYYGTNSESKVGIYNLPTYVTTADAEKYTDIDSTYLVPVDNSIDSKHLVSSLRNKINNNYHTILDDGVVISSEINSLNFGNNLQIDIDGHRATINATGSGSGANISKFVNLDDVEVTYSGNKGKMVVVNETEDALELAKAPNYKEFLTKDVYVDPTQITKVRHSILADEALNATVSEDSAKVNGKEVNDNDDSTGSLWTASKIISNTSSQIAEEGVRTYHGTSAPSNSLGKDGDLFILIEG